MERRRIYTSIDIIILLKSQKIMQKGIDYYNNGRYQPTIGLKTQLRRN